MLRAFLWPAQISMWFHPAWSKTLHANTRDLRQAGHMKLLIAGCGYVGRRVAQVEQAGGNDVSALVRTRFSAEQLAQQGVGVTTTDLDATNPNVPKAEGVYYFLPPPPDGQQDPRIDRFLAALSAVPQRIVLISTTGVYGNCEGAWVDESHVPAPQAGRAQRRLHAERTLLGWCKENGVRPVILRVPGIYGPGKLPLERLRRQEPVLDPELSPWSNRVHVDDLVRACVAAMHHPDPQPVYNISDGHPSTMSDYFFAVADASGLPRPPVLDRAAATQQLSAGMQSYLAESKRIDNRLMREHLGVVPAYPDLASGLAASIKEG